MNGAFIPCFALANSADIGRRGLRWPGAGQGGGPTGGGRGGSGGGREGEAGGLSGGRRGGEGGERARAGAGDIRRISVGSDRSLGERLWRAYSGGERNALSFEGDGKGKRLTRLTGSGHRCFLCPLGRRRTDTERLLQVEARGSRGRWGADMDVGGRL